MRGAICPSLTQEAECNTHACPVDCLLDDPVWGSCSHSCGTGTQTRTRKIIWHGDYGGVACPTLDEVQNCNTHPCPVDCVQSDWSTWDTCTLSCGTGSQTRSRKITTQVLDLLGRCSTAEL